MNLMRRREEVVKGAAATGTAGQVLAAVMVERGGRSRGNRRLVRETPRGEQQGVKSAEL